ncbi:MAG: glutamate--tRNA ligase [Bacilli bacterium]|nr:glutamate--tRNA ligase [Bacilli bacterium]MDD4607803.1 glutamate--tRNA ligase [Bacilli bacterium]
MRVRTRYAPSPTGFMHVGNLRSAIFEYLIAKNLGGDFLLRIEDTDQTRRVEGAVEFIYDTCKLCGLDFDEGPNNPGNYGPYTQSERLDIYQKYAHELVDMGKAYYCFCSEDRLAQLREYADKKRVAFLYDGHCKSLTKEEIEKRINNGEKYVIRQKMPKEGISTYEDVVYGEITVENKILEDQILLKSDGFPTYNFANVIDDHLMEITHVARGNEYLMSTPKYNLLYEAFGWEKPTYIHLPMVLGGDGLKLSKRNGDASFMDLYHDGYLPEGVVNYLALLGWSPETTDEIFTLDDLIKIFNPKRISKSPAIYDIKKLNWINAHYIKRMELDDLVKITVPHLESAYDLSDKSDEWVKHLVSIYQNHISYGKEIVEVTDLFFKEDISMNDECKEFMTDSSVENTLKVFEEEINNISDWTVQNITDVINNVKEKANVKGKMLYMPIRIKISGQMHGPELPDTIYLLGKEVVINRLNK